jgi:HK97 family phage major capsid protein
MSQTVGEKKVTAELITFNANKVGGIIRIPTELEEDTFIPIGQFIARYIARRFAFVEDDTLWNGDGTSTYANQTGIALYCTNNPSYLQQLGAGKTKPSDATLADFRTMRALINAAAYNNGAYYMHPTMDTLLVSYNTSATVVPYRRNPDGSATLDGFPIRWTGVHQAYKTAASPNANLATFGDLSYIYLGERGQPRVEVSRDVYFVTDELGMRALERIDVEIMAVDAVSTLKTAAS